MKLATFKIVCATLLGAAVLAWGDDRVKLLLWHGYLLGGTGSNVYTRSLARVWSRLGHEVVVFCQDPEPGRYDLGAATVVRPDIGAILPVFVRDRYEGFQPRLLQKMLILLGHRKAIESHSWPTEKYSRSTRMALKRCV